MVSSQSYAKCHVQCTYFVPKYFLIRLLTDGSSSAKMDDGISELDIFSLLANYRNDPKLSSPWRAWRLPWTLVQAKKV